MNTITRRFTFDAAHRVLGHGGKCRHLHGHHYVAEVTVHSPELDTLGMVMDFSEVKQLIGEFIDLNWDHNILLNDQDPLAFLYRDGEPKDPYGPTEIEALAHSIFNGKTPYFFNNKNPTAEIIAAELFHKAQVRLNQTAREMNGVPYKIQPTHVRVYETPNCWSDYFQLPSS